MLYPQNILDFLNGQQQEPVDKVQGILTNRWQPNAQDVGNAALAGISNNSYVNPQSYADQRMESAMKQIMNMAQMQKAQQPLLDKGLIMNNQTGRYEPVPGYGEAMGNIASKELMATLPGKIALASAGGTRVNVNNAQESEENKAVGKAFGTQYVDLQKAGLDAPGKIAKYDRMNQLLEGINTGAFKGTTTDLKAAAKGIGMNLEAIGVRDDVAPIQAAQALTNAMALELRNPSGGAGMPGAMSDADRVYLQSMTPGIEKTKEGRALMTDTAKKLAQRDAEIAQLARNYRSRNGRLDEGFYNILSDYSNQNPLFVKNGAPPQAPANRPPLSSFMK